MWTTKTDGADAIHGLTVYLVVIRKRPYSTVPWPGAGVISDAEVMDTSPISRYHTSFWATVRVSLPILIEAAIFTAAPPFKVGQ